MEAIKVIIKGKIIIAKIIEAKTFRARAVIRIRAIDK